MRKKLLKYIVCPSCQSRLTVTTESIEGDHIIEGGLSCRCGKTYPIHRGVPRLLDQPSGVEKHTADRFGYEWKKFPEFDGGHADQFLRWLQPLKREFFRGKIILDGGCGKGRHLFFSSQFGAKEVIGIDLSEAVEAAFANTKHLDNVHVIQANIYHPPFRKQVFDFIYSLGVLHHLPHPREGFRSLCRFVKRDGQISIWLYGHENSSFMVNIIEPLRKSITSKMNLRVLKLLSFFLTIPLFSTIKSYALLNKISKTTFSSLPYWEYFLQFSQFTFRHSWLNVLDKLLAPVAFYYKRTEVEEWFAENYFKRFEVYPCNNISWTGHGYVR